jgi:hypothetical protein
VWVVALSGAAVLAAGAGVTLAAIPDNNGVIHGCYHLQGRSSWS